MLRGSFLEIFVKLMVSEMDMSDTTVHRKLEKANLRIDTLVAEADRLKELCQKMELLLLQAKELLVDAECGPSVYVDVQKRGEWRTKRQVLVSKL
jgi:hypothetical protein